MKINEFQQRALDEIARQLYIAECANKAKAVELDKIPELIARNEDEFRSGIEASFVIDNRRFTCRLVLKPSPKWMLKDPVITVEK